MLAAFKQSIAENPHPSLDQILAGINRGIAESERAERPVVCKYRVSLYTIAILPTTLAVGTVIWRIMHALARHH